ncbi:MAG: tetratricopeptide repeat protein [Bacteroidota bacterium]
MNTKKNRQTPRQSVSDSRLRWLLALVAIILYVQTIPYGYTLDDEIFILKNTTVQNGISGIYDLFVNGSLSDFGIQPYRPVTLSSFAIEKSLVSDSSIVRHFINLMSYLLLLQVLLTLLRRLFKELHPVYCTAIVLLFAVHPLHTEAVASVKGRDELFAAIFALLAWIRFLPDATGQSANGKNIAFGTLLFGLSCFSKESGIVFLALIPLADFFFISKNLKRSFFLSVPLAGMAFIYLFARQTVNGGIVVDSDIPVMANILNATSNSGELWATRTVLLFYYVKLLFVPWPMTWDYSYDQIPVHTWSDSLPYISLTIYLILAFTTIWQLRKNPIISFCILFFFIASLPTNNLLFRTGSTMGERFLFMPSLGFCIIVVLILLKWSKVELRSFNGTRALRGFLPFISLIGLFTVATWARNPDWRNNLTLFKSGVETAPNSTRTQYSLASEYMRLAQKEPDNLKRNELLANARKHFEKSISIYPENYQAFYNAGICLSLSGDTMRAIDFYKKTIALNRKYLTAMNNVGVLYQARLEFDSADRYYSMAYDVDPSQQVAKDNLSNLYFNEGISEAISGNQEAAILSYRKSTVFNPSNMMALNNIASIYTGQKRYDSAIVYLKMAHAVKPDELFVIENIAAVSLLNKNFDQAESFAKKGLQMNPQAQKSLGVLRDIEKSRGK